jgi:type IV pilus assembly protein PilB
MGQRCPSCNGEISPGHFVCPRCELIVDSTPVERAPEPPRETSVVFGLLSPLQGALESPAGPFPLPDEYRDPSAGVDADESTVEFTALPDLACIPVVVGELDPTRHALSSFEAYVVSLIDGVSSLEQVGEAAGLLPVEIQSVIHSLAVRKVVRAEKAAPAPERSTLGKMQPVKQISFVSSPSQPPIAPLQQAIALERRGDFNGAIEILERAIAHANHPAPLYNRLALVLVKERRAFAAAEALLTKALQLEPKNAVYEENLFKVHELALGKVRNG